MYEDYNEPEKIFPDEEWRIITPEILEGVQPWYIVSNYGRVYNFKDRRILHNNVASHHLSVHIRCIIGEENLDCTPTVQRLMMKAFCYFPECEKYEVDHIDECSYNNILFNLQWLTREQNIAKFHNSYYNRYINQLQRERGNNGDYRVKYFDKDRYKKVKPAFVQCPFIFNPITPSQYEIFAPVRGYEYRYLISNMGRIFDKFNGWFCVVFKEAGERYTFCHEINEYVPVAMLKSFKYFSGCDYCGVTFKDGNTLSNYLPNIEWDMLNNFDHKSSTNSGSSSYMATLTEDQVRQICELFQQGGYTYREISDIVGIPFSKPILSAIKHRDSWKEISKNYKWDTEKAVRHSPETKAKVIQMIKDGFSQKEIVNALGVSMDYTYRLRVKLKEQGEIGNYGNERK